MSEYTKQELLHFVAPCSLFCYTCPALRDGAVPETAAKLCRYFEGYYDFNDENIPEQYRWWLDDFKKFHTVLAGFTKASCPGCRNNPSPGSGCVEGCIVPECVKAHGVDYCAECNEFPCERGRAFFATVNRMIGRDWEEGNRRVGEIGIEAYFREKKDISHYISYKK